MSAATRKWIFAVVRLGVCTIALAWVLHNVTYYDYVTLADGSRLRALDIGEASITTDHPDPQLRVINCADNDCAQDPSIDIEWGMHTTWSTADSTLLIIGLLIFFPATPMQAWRFQFMLRAQDIRISFWESLKLCYAGNFLNFITALGNTGGDVFKMYYVSLHTDRKTEAVTTVILDRIVGLFGLLLIVACVILVRLGDSKLAMLGYGIGVIMAGGALGAVVLFSKRVRSLVRPERLLGRLPFAEQLRRIDSATRRLAQHKKLVFASLGCTMGVQIFATTSFVLTAVALGMKSHPAAIWDYYAYLPGGMVVSAIPISFQGLGTMEAFFKHSFLGTHGTLSAILCLAMMIRAIGLFWALPGVIVTMTGAYRPRISEDEVQFA